MISTEEVKDVQLFRAACQSHLEKIAKSVSEDRFIELFTESGVSKSQSKKLYNVFQSVIVKGLTEQVDEMITEEKLSEKFVERAEIFEAQKEFEGATAWRPTGQPPQDLRSHDVNVLVQMKSALQEYLTERNAHVDDLFEKVKSARQRAAEAHSTIKSRLRTISEDNAVLDQTMEQYLKTLKTLVPSDQERNTGSS